jgi:predicted HTH domain antitoxin
VANLTPIFASERTAARLLDMSVAAFKRLVKEGSLPPATRFDRWDVEELRQIMRGDAAKYGQRLDL